MNQKTNHEKKENEEINRIVIIEDDDTIMDLICDFLEDEGYTPITFYSPDEANGKVNPTDILISDVRIKNNPTAGVDFALEMRNRKHEPYKRKVIFISNFDQEPVREKLKEIEGYYYWLNKPFELQELSEKIEEIKNNG